MIFTPLCLSAQSEGLPRFLGPVVYVELYGAGAGVTLNAEHSVMRMTRNIMTVRAGFGKHRYLGKDEHDYIGIPVGMCIFNKGSNHHREFGLGITYVKGHLEEDFFGEVNKSLEFVASIGYRYQRPAGGLFFKVQYTPHVRIKEFTESNQFNSGEGKIVHLAGICLGYYFMRR